MATLTSHRGRPPRVASLLALASLAFLATASRADGPSREYQVKAAFLYNFVQFIEWPEQAFANAQSPIVITVVGENPFGGAIELVTRGKLVRGREIVVRYAPNTAAATGSHVLFIAAAPNRPPAQAVKDAAGPGRLTVSDADGFVAGGGCVQFYAEENRLRFSINTSAAARAGLKVSAKLLQLAKVYKEE